MLSKKTIIMLLLAFLGLSSCSRTHLLLQFVDDVVAYEISSEFNLSGKADDQVEELSAQFFKEFKKHLIPFLVKEIDLALKTLRGMSDVKEVDYTLILNQSVERLTLHLEAGKPIILKYSLQGVQLIEPQNWDHFLKRFEKKNSQILSTKVKSRLKDNFERFLGDMTEDQEALLDQFLSENPFLPQVRVNHRQATIRRFKEIVGPSFSKESFEKATRQWLQDPDSFGDSDAEKYFERRKLNLTVLIGKVLKVMTDKQKKHLVKKLESLREELQENLHKA